MDDKIDFFEDVCGTAKCEDDVVNQVGINSLQVSKH